MYTQEDVITFVKEENVKFTKLAFFDVFGVQKNISILPRGAAARLCGRHLL